MFIHVGGAPSLLLTLGGRCAVSFTHITHYTWILRFQTDMIHPFLSYPQNKKYLHYPWEVFFTIWHMMIFSLNQKLWTIIEMSHFIVMAQFVIGHATFVYFLSFDPHRSHPSTLDPRYICSSINFRVKVFHACALKTHLVHHLVDEV